MTEEAKLRETAAGLEPEDKGWSETANPREAYARFERPQPGRPQGWEQLPWVQGG